MPNAIKGIRNESLATLSDAELDLGHVAIDRYGRLMSLGTGSLATFTSTPTITTGSAYSSGYLLGTKITLSSALVSPYSTIIHHVAIIDLDMQMKNIDVVFFNADPTATTFTDRAAFDIADADITKIPAGAIKTVNSHYSFNDNGISLPSDKTPIRMIGTTTSLYAALVVRNTVTYSSANGITLVVTIERI